MRRAFIFTLSVLISLNLLSLGPLPEGTNFPQLSSIPNNSVSQTSPIASQSIQDFRLLSQNTAWILSNQNLFWTSTDGDSWVSITPEQIGQRKMQAVEFSDPHNGWLVAVEPGPSGIDQFTFFSTRDGGQGWESWPLALFSAGDPDGTSGAVYLEMIDAQNGWLTVKTATSSNFSRGTLFRTSDGGRSWQKLALPIGEGVEFSDLQNGWTAGGAAGNELYRTIDGGKSWESITTFLPGFTSDDLVQRPVRGQDGTLLLPVVKNSNDHTQIAFYKSGDGGNSWQVSASLLSDQALSPGTTIPLAAIGSQHWLFSLPGSDKLFELDETSGQVRQVLRDQRLNGLTVIQMSSTSSGWASSSYGSCLGAVCLQQDFLLKTADGGRNWNEAPLPQAADRLDHGIDSNQEFPAASPDAAGIVDLSLTMTMQTQGFDKCEIPTYAQLQDWLFTSPYKVVNLYIGGVSRACSNKALTAQFLHDLSLLGWRFIPTWVGPQANCGNYTYKIPLNTTDAYNKGKAEADLAIDTAVSMGLTEPDKSGTVIYYDLEAFDVNNSSCLKSAHNFISGWTYQMRLRKNLAGVYSRGYELQNFWSLANRPDVIWPANWYYSDSTNPPRYRKDATVWNVAGLSNDYWIDHQRIRQYYGGHAETWGTTSLTIDNNVIDGVVADTSGMTPLNVLKAGNGKGTVTSTPVGIDCGTYCFGNFTDNVLLTLTETPATGSSFTSWSNNCQVTGADTCQVTVDQYKEVTASFTLNPYNLTVNIDGNGSGSVTSSPSGINCGSDCIGTYNYGTIVTLTAQPASDSTLTEWTGPCTATGDFTCEVIIDLVNQVTATFKLAHPLTVEKSGNGKGTVSSSPGGINCGSDCNHKYEIGLSVVLTAAVSPGSVFTGWAGPCNSTTDTTCTVAMDQVQQVSATFISNYIFVPWTAKD